MLEVLKNFALTLALVGFGLSVLLPIMIQINGMVDRYTISSKGFFYNLFWMIIIIICVLLYIAYYVVSLYYIWIK